MTEMVYSGEAMIWGVALMLAQRHGRRAKTIVAERLQVAEVACEEDAVALWTAIDHCLDDIADVARPH